MRKKLLKILLTLMILALFWKFFITWLSWWLNGQFLFLLNLPAFVHDPSNQNDEQTKHKLAEGDFHSPAGHGIKNFSDRPIANYRHPSNLM